MRTPGSELTWIQSPVEPDLFPGQVDTETGFKNVYLLLFFLCKLPGTQDLNATSRGGLQSIFFPEAIVSYSWGRNMITPVQLMRMYGLTALPPLLYEAYDTRVTTATRIHSADQTPELESGALNRWAMTRHVSCF